jgi:WD40 repeat protein
VHRDLKPENVLFTAAGEDSGAEGAGGGRVAPIGSGAGRPLVADLGLAKHWRDDAPGASQSVSLSKTGETRGTAGYMAPEQMNDAKTVGPPADVFSLGAILYECLTGRAAFVGGTIVETMAHAATGSYEPIRPLRPDASAALVRAIDRALAPAAEARFSDGAALANALESDGDGPRSRRLPVAIAASVLVAGAATALALRTSTDAPPSVPAPAPAPARPAARAEPSFPEECRGFRETPLARLVSVWGDHAWSVSDGCWGLVRSPDGKRAFANDYSGFVHVLDLSTGREVLTLRTHGQGCAGIAIARDGGTGFAAAGVIEAWDLATGRNLEPLAGRGEGARSIGLTDSRRVIVGKNDGSVEVWDVVTGVKLGSTRVHAGPVTAIACSPDGTRVITAAEDGTMALGSLASGRFEPKSPMAGHSRGISRVELASDGRTALSCGKDGAIIRWDVTSEPAVLWRIDRAHGGPWVQWIAHSPDGTRAVSAGSSDKLVKVWALDRGTELRTFHSRQTPTAAIFAGEDRVVSCDWSHHVTAWDVARGEQVASSPDAHADMVRSVACSRDGARVATGGDDGTARVWDVASGKPHVTVNTGIGFVGGVAFLPGDKQVVATGYDGFLRIFDASTGKSRAIPTGGGPLQAVALTPDGTQAVTASEDGTAKLWDLASGKPTTIAQIPRDWMQTVAISADGRFVAIGASSQTNVLHVGALGRGRLRVLGGAMNQVSCVAFTPSGQRLYSSSWDGLVRVWDVQSGEQVAELSGHKGTVKALATSPDGRLVITAGKDDGTIRLWNAWTYRELGQISLASSADYATCLAFAPDGRTFAAGTSRGLVLRFELARRDER